MASSDLEKRAKEAFVDDDFDLAVDLYTQAIEKDPKNADLFADLSQANIKLCNYTGIIIIIIISAVDLLFLLILLSSSSTDACFYFVISALLLWLQWQLLGFTDRNLKIRVLVAGLASIWGFEEFRLLGFRVFFSLGGFA